MRPTNKETVSIVGCHLGFNMLCGFTHRGSAFDNAIIHKENMICSKKYTKYTFSQKNLSIGLDIKGICMVYFGCTLGVLWCTSAEVHRRLSVSNS